MSRTETISLSLVVSRYSPQARRSIEIDDNIESGRNDLRRWTAEDRRRLLVLIGSSIAQLPIWGFAMSYGIFQQYYYDDWTLDGSRDITGTIGTTSNGVMYISMPILFALFTGRWAKFRQAAAILGTAIACTSFAISSLSQNIWHLVLTQGVLSAIGCALIFSPLTLSLGEYFNQSNRICNRAIAYAICLSFKNMIGAATPFLFRALLDLFGFRDTLRIWAAILWATAMLAVFMVPTLPNIAMPSHSRSIPWSFLRHKTFYIYSIATLSQSAGYGIPQTYLTEYARNISSLSVTFSTLLIALINIPGVAASYFFGFLSDNRHFKLSITTVTALSALASAVSTFLFWGLADQGGTALLTLFVLTFGFFASGYSATWGGVINEMEREARDANEALDTGVLYGLLNGARGIGYVGGGLISVPLVNAGHEVVVGKLGYATIYGPLIMFTGWTLALGGWGVLWKCRGTPSILRRL